jgi:hypothetical protein
MHVWGDKDFDWEGLEAAMRGIVKELKFVRIPVRDFKEKWGTARIYCQLGWYSVHDIIYPGYAYSKFPQWLWDFDIYHGTEIVPFLCNWLVLPIHKYCYRRAYKRAIKKYPHLREEILCCADYNDLLYGL